MSLLGQAGDLGKADGASGLFFGPPQSVAIIEAGVTAATKAWTALFGAGATLTSVIGLVKWGTFTNDGLHTAIIFGMAIFLAAMVLAIAWIVNTDVRSRADGAVAIVGARASIASNFLALTRQSTAPDDQLESALLVAAALTRQLHVQLKGDVAYKPVKGLRTDPIEGLQFHVGDDWVKRDKFGHFKSAP